MAIERRLSTLDLSWFLDLNANKQLDLEPPYQRRSVWSPKDRRFFLDTIFNGYPSPAVFLHKQMIDGKTVYAVVDGKQRLETIFMFANNKIAIDKNFGDSRLAGKRWKTIKQDEGLARVFWDYVVAVEFTSAVEPNVVTEIFDRFNRNSRKLTEQELRHAKYDGWFISFVEREAELPDWEDLGIVTTSRAKRMRDIQFLSELLIVILKDDVGGFDQEEINQYCADYDNLSDLEVPFVEEDIKQEFQRCKKYMINLESEASVISKYARDFTHFYTLWGVVALCFDKLPPARVTAPQYSIFMEQVGKYADGAYLARVMSHDETTSDERTLEYYQNSIGATTEPPQRQRRHNTLSQVLIEATEP